MPRYSTAMTWTLGIACASATPARYSEQEDLCFSDFEAVATEDIWASTQVDRSSAELKLSVLKAITEHADSDAEEIADLIGAVPYDVAGCLRELESDGLVYRV